MAKLSEQLLALRNTEDIKNLCLENFLEKLSINGHMIPALFCAIPFILPIPVPGLSTIAGVIIMVLGIAITFSIRPWIPEKFKKLEIRNDIIQAIFERLAKISQKIEFIFKPRILVISQHRYNYKFNGLIIFCCGLLLALPLPPGTNLPPALNIIILAIADIEDDGLMILIGYFYFILMAIAFILFINFGVNLISK